MPGARGDRERAAHRGGDVLGPARLALGRGLPPRHRRLRHRLFQPRLPHAPADRDAQDRPVVRARPLRRHGRRGAHRRHHQPRGEPAAQGRRRGRGDRERSSSSCATPAATRRRASTSRSRSRRSASPSCCALDGSRFGIDLGGTKIEIAALDAAGAVRLRRRVRHARGELRGDARRDRARWWRTPSASSGSAARWASATPGALSLATGRVKNSNSTLPERPAAPARTSRRGSGARCASPTTPTASRSPRRSTAPRAGARIVFGVILGTGVGGGIVVDRRVLTGANAIAGEWGHNPLPLPRGGGPAAAARAIAGARGCIETYLSGPALAADHARAQRRAPRRRARSRARADARRRALRGHDRALRGAARARARLGDQRARSRRDRAGRRALATSTRLYAQRARALGRARVLRRRAHAPRAAGARRLERRARRRLALGAADMTGAHRVASPAPRARSPCASLVLAWSGIAPKDRFTWFLEMVPGRSPPRCDRGAAIRAGASRRWCSTLIAIHAVILMVGGKYTYAEVPLFNWLRDEFGLARNYYDRVGHFAQGFVPAMVAREILLRHDVLRRGRVALLLRHLHRAWRSARATSSSSGGSRWRRGEAAEAFLGTQGDVWDTQWDMFLALCGAIAAQLALARWHDRQLGIVRDAPGTVTLREVTEDNIDRVARPARGRAAEVRHRERRQDVLAGERKHPTCLGARDLRGRGARGAAGARRALARRAARARTSCSRACSIDAALPGPRLRARGDAPGARLTRARARAAERIKLSHMPSNKRVGRYYGEFGFRHTGVADEDGELEMVLELASPGGVERPMKTLPRKRIAMKRLLVLAAAAGAPAFAQAPQGPARPGGRHLRRRLLLVHGAALRQAPRRQSPRSRATWAGKHAEPHLRGGDLGHAPATSRWCRWSTTRRR